MNVIFTNYNCRSLVAHLQLLSHSEASELRESHSEQSFDSITMWGEILCRRALTWVARMTDRHAHAHT